MRWLDKYAVIAAAGWHIKFAWVPVWLDEPGCWCWLERYQRRGRPHYDFMSPYIEWETREMPE